MEVPRRRPTPAMAVALAALVAATGGSAVADSAGGESRKQDAAELLSARSVTGALVRSRTVRARHVALDALTGRQIDESTLRKVRSARKADTATSALTAGWAATAGWAPVASRADSAARADTAGRADAAGRADSATTATSATTADHAETADHAAKADTLVRRQYAALTEAAGPVAVGEFVETTIYETSTHALVGRCTTTHTGATRASFDDIYHATMSLRSKQDGLVGEALTSDSPFDAGETLSLGPPAEGDATQEGQVYGAGRGLAYALYSSTGAVLEHREVLYGAKVFGRDCAFSHRAVP